MFTGGNRYYVLTSSVNMSSSFDKPVQDFVTAIKSKVIRDYPDLCVSHKSILEKTCAYASEAYQKFVFGCVPWVTEIDYKQDFELDVQQIEHLKTIRQSLVRCITLEEEQLLDRIIERLDKDATCTIPDMITLAECMPKFAKDLDVYKFFAVDGLLGNDTTRYVDAFKYTDYRKRHAQAVREMYALNITTSPEDTKEALETIFRIGWHIGRHLYVDTVGGWSNVDRIHRYICDQQAKLNSLSDYRKRVQVKQCLEGPLDSMPTCVNDTGVDKVVNYLLFNKRLDATSCEDFLPVFLKRVSETYQEDAFGCSPFDIVPSIDKSCQLNEDLMHALRMAVMNRVAFITDEEECIINNILGKDQVLVTDLLDLAGCLYKITYPIEVWIFFAVDGTLGYDATGYVDSFKYNHQSIQYRHAEAVRNLYRTYMICSPYEMYMALEAIFNGEYHPVRDYYIHFMGGWINVKRVATWIEKRKETLNGLDYEDREKMYRKRMTATKTLKKMIS